MDHKQNNNNKEDLAEKQERGQEKGIKWQPRDSTYRRHQKSPASLHGGGGGGEGRQET